MKILILGSTGMLGHVVEEHFLKSGYNVYSTSREKGEQYYFEATDNMFDIEKIIKEIKPEVIINCIGILNEVAENNKSLAILINSYLPHYLDELSEKYGYKLIHISTDCVFSGEKGEYYEDSFKDATSFYGQSKGLGEINNDKNITLRTSIIGPDINPNGIGLFQWFMNQNEAVGGFTKVYWTGVTTIQLAKNIEEAINNKLVGLYHVVNGEKITKYDLLYLFKKYFDKDIIINENDSYVSDKSLISTKDYKFDVPRYEQMIKEMYDWINEKEMLYKNSMNIRRSSK